MDFDWDCIVVGAGPAGLSAALTLGRALRRVTVLDSGAPRNAAAHAMHGVLGHDGLPPSALRAKGVAELARYAIEVRFAEVLEATAFDGGVEVNGERARALIIATGLLDETPAVEGFDAIYGTSAHNCPYCDGAEHRDQRIAVYAPNPAAAAHMGPLLRGWSPDVALLTDGADGLDADAEAAIAAAGVRVVRERVTRFAHEDGTLRAVELEGAEPLERDALFFGIALEPRTALAQSLGCPLDDGGFIVAGADRQTGVDRVYAAGNCADPMMNVVMAIADGARAAVAVNVRLIGEGVVR